MLHLPWITNQNSNNRSLLKICWKQQRKSLWYCFKFCWNRNVNNYILLLFYMEFYNQVITIFNIEKTKYYTIPPFCMHHHVALKYYMTLYQIKYRLYLFSQNLQLENNWFCTLYWTILPILTKCMICSYL